MTSIVETMVDQIGMMNILAISGGRVLVIDENTIILPVSNGYHVEVSYDTGLDTYEVARVFRRAGKRFIKGWMGNVYSEELGEMAYQASSFRSYPFGKEVAS